MRVRHLRKHGASKNETRYPVEVCGPRNDAPVAATGTPDTPLRDKSVNGVESPSKSAHGEQGDDETRLERSIRLQNELIAEEERSNQRKRRRKLRREDGSLVRTVDGLADGSLVRTMDGVADGSLVRLVWNEGFKVAGDGALALVRGARVGCHSCAFRKTLPNFDWKKNRNTVGHTCPLQRLCLTVLVAEEIRITSAEKQSFYFAPQTTTTMNASSRGDLGFIPNARAQMHSRSLMGAPSNLSKKGVAINSARTPNDTPPQAFAPEARTIGPTSETMVGKRTEWLEVQERRLSATIQEQRNEHDKIINRVNDVEATARAQANQIFEDTQWMYGWTTNDLYGIQTDNGQMYSALEQFEKSESKELTLLSSADRWVLLSYPMQEIRNAKDDSVQMLMKMRTVDANTGQLGLCWAVVATQAATECTRSIGEFAVAPYTKN